MKCYHCGCRLSEKEFCTACGADVAQYKKVMYMSNQFYNDGLERAQVRDLSGAIGSLRQSLKFNKENTQARNLLGLVYFEMGETVAALSEWVISKNFQAEKNIADDYIDMIQSNPAGLENINATIKKFNQSITYCQQESYDVAKIQLKKVVNMNSKLIQARQLLALLFMKDEEWQEAKRELEACKKIDIGNTMTNRYLKEVDTMLGFEDDKELGRKKKKTAAAVQLVSGYETIIQPNNAKEAVGWNILFNILIGLLIGLAIGWLLLAPLRAGQADTELETELADVREQLAVKTAAVAELKQQIDTMGINATDMQEELDDYKGATGMVSAHKNLMLAQAEFNKGAEMDKLVIADYLEQIDDTFLASQATEEFILLYDTMKAEVGPFVSASYYTTGYEAYRNDDYATAIKDLIKAVNYDATNGEALYALASAYEKDGDTENAKITYIKVIELFPGTEKATKAQNAMNQIDGAEEP